MSMRCGREEKIDACRSVWIFQDTVYLLGLGIKIECGQCRLPVLHHYLCWLLVKCSHALLQLRRLLGNFGGSGPWELLRPWCFCWNLFEADGW